MIAAVTLYISFDTIGKEQTVAQCDNVVKERITCSSLSGGRDEEEPKKDINV
jgi:hypothetical protein